MATGGSSGASPQLGEHGQLINNLILFGRLLRQLGLDVNPGRMLDAVAALRHVDIGRRSDFYYTLQTLLVTRHDDLELFHQAFELFWRQRLNAGIEIDLAALIARHAQPRRPVVAPGLPGQEAAESTGEDDADAAEEVLEITRTYSDQERLRHKEFATLNPEELANIRRLMARLIWRLGERRTRRMRTGRGRRLDLRRSLRRSFRYGGEPLELARLANRLRPRSLVILADISGSMERYTRLLIHFLYSLAEGLDQRVEVFVFSTRLTRITRQLRGRDVDRALSDVAGAVPDWSGGTRIGEAIKTFNFDWGRRVLRGGAIGLVISDGWDRGDPALLRREMARLHRTCHRLIWLNPLLGSPDYEPLTRGIMAALPHVDDFLPVHNLASLEDLASHLAQLDDRRSGGRQAVAKSGAAFVRR